MDFYTKISPTFAGKKFQIPTPTCCPDCRQKRRLSFRNERNLYRRICDASGKQIISMYKPDNGYIIYDKSVRRSDARDPQPSTSQVGKSHENGQYLCPVYAPYGMHEV